MRASHACKSVHIAEQAFQFELAAWLMLPTWQALVKGHVGCERFPALSEGCSGSARRAVEIVLVLVLLILHSE